MRPPIRTPSAVLEARQPLGRLVSADDVAHAIAYLASPRSGSTTGTVLAVDGGMFGLRLPPRMDQRGRSGGRRRRV
jgi:NAD(P)-dependent dehydrogenase (short-subunit alcohol dehydrogenase family)